MDWTVHHAAHGGSANSCKNKALFWKRTVPSKVCSHPSQWSLSEFLQPLQRILENPFQSMERNCKVDKARAMTEIYLVCLYEQQTVKYCQMNGLLSQIKVWRWEKVLMFSLMLVDHSCPEVFRTSLPIVKLLPLPWLLFWQAPATSRRRHSLKAISQCRWSYSS